MVQLIAEVSHQNRIRRKWRLKNKAPISLRQSTEEAKEGIKQNPEA